MDALGTQLLLEMRGCDPGLLDDLGYIQDVLLAAAVEMDATVLGHTFHKFSPHGVTGIVAIAESHLSIHTWPEYGYAAVDIFTCGNVHPERAADLIVSKMRSREPAVFEVKRGILKATRESTLAALGGEHERGI
ncbi:MAG: adenosylmethionine decarboxylase [Dehalococcoidia bacterium]|nr:adenosylmethionine decarboxylase [Dehalococcoidia bacterium]MDP6510839.1 adenosylmethionine decarboxylase [Dehalococcoidia bacterium]MDP6783721.1 adenosylmethionine decarboxylase [Dehalococcoidia bacterium]